MARSTCRVAGAPYRNIGTTLDLTQVIVGTKGSQRPLVRVLSELRQVLNSGEIDILNQLFHMRSAFATLHRGWLDVRAAMIIGRDGVERMVSREAHRVESSLVVRGYEEALGLKLPEPVGTLLQRQQAEINATVAQLEALAGTDAERLLVQLYVRNEDAHSA